MSFDTGTNWQTLNYSARKWARSESFSRHEDSRRLRHYHAEHPEPVFTPEHTLWTCVLSDAVGLLLGRGRVRRKIPQARNDGTDLATPVGALHYLFSYRKTIGSARWICDQIGVDYDAMIRRIIDVLEMDEAARRAAEIGPVPGLYAEANGALKQNEKKLDRRL